MTNGYLTGCALAICVLIFFIYFLKKRVDNIETKLYKYMIITNLFESTFTNLIVIVALTINSEFILKILNRLDVMAIITWCSLMFLYIVSITFYSRYNQIKKCVIATDIFFFILALLLNVTIIVTDTVLDSAGPLTVFALLAGGFYIVLMLVSVLLNKKRDYFNQKLIPLYLLIFLIIAMALLRVIIPRVNFVSIIISFVNLIMFFTIENPDVKMIAQLEIERENAEKANRAKSDFLSSMSHEIRTPLNAIVGLSEDIYKYRESLPPEVLEDAEDIVNASNTLLEIVGNILDINKIESDKMEIALMPYDFRGEIEALIRVTSTRIGSKPIHFTSSIAEDIPHELIGDKVHIKGIVNNLLTNAIKYTDEGSVSIHIHCINEGDISNLIIQVQDTGRGIKREDIDKLFTKFERLGIEKNSTTEGTGLGLAITKRLVEMMGGKINVQSTYGKGSLFVVSIPQKISKRSPLTNTQALNTIAVRNELRKNYRGKKVLIVDDNKLNIKVAKKALGDLDLIIEEAMSGEECLNKVKMNGPYDVILMDIMMPGMNGIITLQELKKDPSFKTPTIALTADAIAGAEEKYISDGFVSYIAKPFNKEQIAEKLDEVFK